ncbi:MAG TPA: aminoglycoside phosphotransferase family protein [Candidatus Paceibacterota bacterium]|nr:aminoglycoside phosphotransferase family protein [Candidatus Paceibacterota bacterium]
MKMTEPPQAVLDRFGIAQGALLGEGSESWVYALDDARVLRIAKDSARRPHFEDRMHFYESLPRAALPFAIPRVQAIEEHAGAVVSIEERIHGSPLLAVLPALSPGEKRHAFGSFLDAALALRAVTRPDLPYGELLADRPVTATTWREYLAMKVRTAAEDPVLRADVPQLAHSAREAQERIAMLAEPEHALVHGDYFPGNVLMDESLAVAGVIDFSPMTLIGDPQMDIAGAFLFLEVTPGATAADSAFMRELIVARAGEAILPVIECYRLYYSFYFAFARDDAPLYRWCVANLAAAADPR